MKVATLNILSHPLRLGIPLKASLNVTKFTKITITDDRMHRSWWSKSDTKHREKSKQDQRYAPINNKKVEPNA